MISTSVKAKEKSYSPYSKFRVGAALLCEDGTVFTGMHALIYSNIGTQGGGLDQNPP